MNNFYISEEDKIELKSLKRDSKGAAICYILFFLLIPCIVGWVLCIVGGVKGLNLKNQKLKEEFKILSILLIVLGIFTIIGGIVVGFIISGKCSQYINSESSYPMQPPYGQPQYGPQFNAQQAPYNPQQPTQPK